MEQQGVLTENRQQKRWVEEIDQKNAEIDRLRMHLRFVQPQIHRLQAEVALKTQQVIGLNRNLEAARQEIGDVIDSKNCEIAAIKSDGNAAIGAKVIVALERVIEDLKAGHLDMEEESEEGLALVETGGSGRTIEDAQVLEAEKLLLELLAIPGIESRARQLLKLKEPLRNVGDKALGVVGKCLSDAALYHPMCPVPPTFRPDINTSKALYGISPSYVWGYHSAPKILQILDRHASMKNDHEENRRLSDWVKAELDSRGLSHLFSGPKKHVVAVAPAQQSPARKASTEDLTWW